MRDTDFWNHWLRIDFEHWGGARIRFSLVDRPHAVGCVAAGYETI